VGQQPQRVGGVSTVGHAGEILGHHAQLLGHLAPLRQIQAARSSSSIAAVFSVSAMTPPPASVVD